MFWNFKIEESPVGYSTDRAVERLGKIVKIPEFVPTLFISASKCGQVIVTYKLENGRYHGYAKDEKPIAWMPMPEHPSFKQKV